MATEVSKELLDGYRKQGFLFPLPALSDSETAALRTKLEELEAQQGGKLPPHINRKPHLLLTWLNELIRHPAFLILWKRSSGPTFCVGDPGFSSRTHMIKRVSRGTRIRPIGDCHRPTLRRRGSRSRRALQRTAVCGLYRGHTCCSNFRMKTLLHRIIC